MGLTAQGPRWLNNLERAAIDLVFGEYSKPDAEKVFYNDLKIHIVQEYVDANGDHRRGSYGGNTITIAIDMHPCTDSLNHGSALGNEDILKPGNMDFLNTLIHEATHHWQSKHGRYNWRGPGGTGVYDFSKKELKTLKFIREEHPDLEEPEKFEEDYLQLLKEQHASAAAAWFIIGWQLKYASNYVDLTTKYRASVGTVDRYHRIKDIRRDEDGRWISKDTAIRLDEHARWVSKDTAREIASDFNIVLTELRTGYYWRHIA